MKQSAFFLTAALMMFFGVRVEGSGYPPLPLVSPACIDLAVEAVDAMSIVMVSGTDGSVTLKFKDPAKAVEAAQRGPVVCGGAVPFADTVEWAAGLRARTAKSAEDREYWEAFLKGFRLTRPQPLPPSAPPAPGEPEAEDGCWEPIGTSL